MSKLEFESIEECSKFLEGETFIYNDTECVVLSDAEECYVLGYKKAIEKACEWLKENKDHPFIGCEDPCLSGYLTDEFVKTFEKAMKGE